jgi:HK97 gp10 family phage protein
VKTSVKMEGLQQLGEALKEFEVATQAKVLRAALRSAVQPIAEEARRIVKRGDSPDGLHLADAIAVSAPKPTGTRGAVAGVKMLSKNVELADEELEGMFGHGLRFRLPGWRWHMQEFGTAHHAAKPFLRPAFDSKAAEAVRVFADALRDRIERIKKRLAKRAK